VFGRWLRRAIAVLLLVPCIYYLAGLAGALVPAGEPWPATGIAVGLLRGPIHYDFLLPLDSPTRQTFAFAAEQRGVPVNHPDARWLVVGWGSEAFYTTAGSYGDISAGAVWQAVTGDASVMRVDAWGDLAGQEVPGLSWIHLNPAQYAKLRSGIRDSFASDPQGQPQPLAVAGFTGTDGFWHGRGGFDLFRTCNVWVGAQLRGAGLRFGLWTPTPQAVALSIWANQP
jgi:uncharacterized protein (TIGR02117 family)